MSQASLPIVLCDSDDGCTEYFRDDWEMGVSNWRDFVPAGWQYDPYNRMQDDLCPEHRGEGAVL